MTTPLRQSYRKNLSSLCRLYGTEYIADLLIANPRSTIDEIEKIALHDSCLTGDSNHEEDC